MTEKATTTKNPHKQTNTFFLIKDKNEEKKRKPKIKKAKLKNLKDKKNKTLRKEKRKELGVC